ncbi:MAG TPA: hypothetical protein VKS60_00700, partial [Stellaceae bacterium]|nr:hypothetical protein [Stellaceae bacterium]
MKLAVLRLLALGLSAAASVSRAAPVLTTLHAFTGGDDSNRPAGHLAFDSAGSLYGTACGANCGGDGHSTVFKLVPPAGGGTAWTETIVHRFSRAATLQTGVVFDTHG